MLLITLRLSFKSIFLLGAPVLLTSVFFSNPSVFGAQILITPQSNAHIATTVPIGYEVRETIYHSETGRFAVIAAREGKQYVFAGNRREGPYDYIRMLSFSPDGKSVAYSMTEKGREYCIAAGRRSGAYSTVCNPTFSHDGRFIAFEASTNGRYFVTFGSVRSLTALHESPRFDMSTMRPVFGPDGTKLFFALNDYQKSKTLRFVADTRTGKSNVVSYALVGDFVKSPDSGWYAYIASKDGRFFVVTGTFAGEGNDECEGPHYDMVSEPVIAPGGGVLAYIATRNDRQFVVISDRSSKLRREGKPHTRIDNLRFIDGGASLFFTIQSGSVIIGELETVLGRD